MPMPEFEIGTKVMVHGLKVRHAHTQTHSPPPLPPPSALYPPSMVPARRPGDVGAPSSVSRGAKAWREAREHHTPRAGMGAGRGWSPAQQPPEGGVRAFNLCAETGQRSQAARRRRDAAPVVVVRSGRRQALFIRGLPYPVTPPRAWLAAGAPPTASRRLPRPVWSLLLGVPPSAHAGQA